MRKSFFILLTILFLGSTTGFSQSLYLRLGGGYALAASGDYVGNADVFQTGNDRSTALFGSLGKGAVFGLEAGYNIDDHLGVQLGAEYLAGSKTTTNSSTSELFSSRLTSQGNQLRILPAVVMRTGWDVIDPYVRFGLSIPVMSKTKNAVSDSTYIATSMSYTVFTAENEIVGGMSLGFTGALGASYALSDNLSLFAEVAGLSQRVGGVSGKLTSSVRDGVDELSSIDTYTSEWNYVDVLDSESNNPLANPDIDTDSPSSSKSVRISPALS